MLPSLVYVGMDVAKLTLDLHAASEPRSQFRQFPNHPKGHRALIRWLQGLGSVHVVGEATGGYERAVVAALHAANVVVSVVNARHVRDFARATGRLVRVIVRQLSHASDGPARAIRQWGGEVGRPLVHAVTPDSPLHTAR